MVRNMRPMGADRAEMTGMMMSSRHAADAALWVVSPIPSQPSVMENGGSALG